jgi:hypothetical protein
VRALVVALLGWSLPAVAESGPDLTLEVTPAKLGSHPPGELPKLTVAIVNHSTTRSYVLPRPHRLAYEGLPGTFYFEYERARPDGTWEPQSRTFFLNDSRPEEDPHAIVELRPGARVVLDSASVPPLTFEDDVVGKMRAHLVYNVDAEWKRRKTPGAHVGTITSGLIELDQIAGPLEVRLETIAPIVVGTDVDLPKVLRVTVRNRSAKDVTIFGPGDDAGIGFDIYTPNGGVWPKGHRPEMSSPTGTPRTAVLHPGQVVEVFGPHATLGAMPGTWRYPVAESFRLRANFYQPTPQRFHYSDWTQMQSVSK